MLFTLLLILSRAQGQQWQFILLGDDRSDKKPQAMDSAAVNTAELSAIAKDVASLKPDFILFTGDLAFGYTDNTAWFRAGLEQWYAAMKPIFDVGIPVYPVRGNHDAACPDSARVWKQFLADHRIDVPMNGPAGEKGLTFYFDHVNARIIGLDDYQGKSFPGSPDQAGPLFPHVVSNEWLKNLPATQPGTHIFAFSHEMPFRVGRHDDSLNSNPVARDLMMKTLFSMGGRVFLSGHDHDYDLVSAVDPNDKTGNTAMLQMVAGTAGAPFYSEIKRIGNSWPLTPHGHWTKTYGYILVQVEGKKATLIFYGRDTLVSPPETKYTEKQRVSYDLTSMPPVFTFTPDRKGNVDIDGN